MALYGDNPTDPKKTVTKGKTTTTTSTREGSVRGRTGTFTDTVETTPVNTNISGNNSGSEAFNSAFANARKQGLSNFDFGGKKYNTDMGSNTTSNESSTTTTFKPHKVTGVAQLNPSGIKFSKQSYEMGKTQDIQMPKEGMGAFSVSRGNGRDASIGRIKTQEPIALTNKQGEGLQNAGDRINQQLESRFGKERMEEKFAGRSKEFIAAQVKKGETRIANNKVKVKKY